MTADPEVRRGRRAQDREIARLALPAFAALISEPLFLLADAAIVGHLGTAQLAALGIAGTVVQTAVGLFVFLAYGTTSTVARSVGAGDRRGALEVGIDGIWLAVVIGALAGAVTAVLTPQIVAAFGPSDGGARLCDDLPADRGVRHPVPAAPLRGDRRPPRSPGHPDPVVRRRRRQPGQHRAEPAVRLRLRLGHRRVGTRDPGRADRRRGGARPRRPAGCSTVRRLRPTTRARCGRGLARRGAADRAHPDAAAGSAAGHRMLLPRSRPRRSPRTRSPSRSGPSSPSVSTRSPSPARPSPAGCSVPATRRPRAPPRGG